MITLLSNESVSQPVLFIPHGAGPCFFMDWQPADTWYEMATFLKSISARLPERPKAILIISAHWQTAEFSITASKQPDLIYDYYGFPEHTYSLTYPASGAPALAEKVIMEVGEAIGLKMNAKKCARTIFHKGGVREKDAEEEETAKRSLS